MASVRRRPGRPSPWEAVFRDPSGRQQTRAFRRKVDAQRWLDEQTAAIVTGQYISPTAGRTTIRKYGEQWRAAQVHRPSSADRIESILRLHVYPLLGDRHVAAVRPSDIQAWVKRLLVEQVLALEAAMPARWRAMVPLGAAAGPRVSEALGLTVDRTGLKPPLDQAHAAYRPPARGAQGRDPLPGTAEAQGISTGRARAPGAGRGAGGASGRLSARASSRRGRRTWTEVVELVFTTARGQPLTRSLPVSATARA